MNLINYQIKYLTQICIGNLIVSKQKKYHTQCIHIFINIKYIRRSLFIYYYIFIPNYHMLPKLYCISVTFYSNLQ